MATKHTGHTQPSIDLEEHRSVNGVNAKAVIPYYLDSSGNPQPGVADQIAQAVYEALVHMMPYQHAIPYARTSTDQMRVNIDAGTLSQLNTITWGNANAEPTYYSTGAPISVDIREEMALLSEQNFNFIRQGRWIIT